MQSAEEWWWQGLSDTTKSMTLMYSTWVSQEEVAPTSRDAREGRSNWRELLRETRLLAMCLDFAIASGRLSTPSNDPYISQQGSEHWARTWAAGRNG